MSHSSELKYNKSEGDSRRYRDAGNKHYLAGRDVEAIKLFNKAIVAAPQDGEGKGRDYSLAVANRSASLLRLGYRDLCLQEVQLALAGGYPAELRSVSVSVSVLPTPVMMVELCQLNTLLVIREGFI